MATDDGPHEDAPPAAGRRERTTDRTPKLDVAALRTTPGHEPLPPSAQAALSGLLKEQAAATALQPAHAPGATLLDADEAPAAPSRHEVPTQPDRRAVAPAPPRAEPGDAQPPWGAELTSPSGVEATAPRAAEREAPFAPTALRPRHEPAAEPPADEPGFEPTRPRARAPEPTELVPFDATALRASAPAPEPEPEPPLDPTVVRRVTPGPALPPAELAPGTMLGEYRVDGPLGSGGMGLVYRGVQPVIGRPVAIKVLKAEFARDPAHVRRFLDEARAVSAARHPGIIDVFSVGQTPAGLPYLVMELLEGESLEELLRRKGRLSPKEALELLLPTLNALATAHGAGVIHRDLKPANLFIVTLQDGTRFPKVLDFGLARRGEAGAAAVRQTSVGGTPLYIAPEQVRGEAVSPRTDLYSFGCVLYEVLTGQPPFRAGNLNQLIEQHLTLEPEPPSRLAPEVPPRLEQVVLQLLAKAPEARPQSAAQARQLLEQAGADVRPAPRQTAQLEADELSKKQRVAKARGPRAPLPLALDEGRDTPLSVEAPTPGPRTTMDEPAAAVPPPPRRWLVPGVVLLLAALAGGAVVWAMREGPPAPPVAPVPLAVPVRTPEPEVPVAPPEAPTVAPPEAPPTAAEPPLPAVSKKPAKHTQRDVQRKHAELSRRIAGLPDDLRRAAAVQLEEAKQCRRSAERCWRELADIEATFFPR